jgi:ABC-type phosphate transport system substrate-binding protein
MKYTAATLLALSLSLSLPVRVAAENGTGKRVVVILHPSNGTSAMDLSQLALIYKGVRRSWNSHLRISVFLPPTTSPAMAELAADVFKVPRPEDVSTFYANAVQRKIFTAQPPILASDAEVVKRVAAEPGAIGVVDASQIADPASVKTLVVGGL